MDGANGGFHLVVAVVGEGGEIFFSWETFGGAANRVEIEFLRDVPGGAAEEWIHGDVIEDVVTVLLAGGVEAGVKRIGDFARIHDADVVGKLRVEGERHFQNGHAEAFECNVEVGDHGAGVDAGVGAAGVVKANLLLENTCDGFLDDLLDTEADFLNLPAGVVGTVVGDGELEAHGD